MDLLNHNLLKKTYDKYYFFHHCDYKFFFKLKGNSKVAGFGSYLMGLFSGSITLQAHKEAVSEMKKTFGKLNVYIHNMELDWFHIKEKII